MATVDLATRRSDVAQRIRQCRERIGLTQRQLEILASLPYKAITKIENGNRLVEFVELELIAAALGLSIGDF